MNLQEQVAQLQNALPKLKANDQDFAISLIASFKKYKKLSPKQEPWIGKLLERATTPAFLVVASSPAAVEVGSFEGVIALFAKAKAHLKFPKITLLCLGKPVTLAVAGAASKAAGSINVMGEGQYPNRAFYGRVSPEGVWTPSFKTSPEMLEALTVLLTKFSAQPARVAKEHGKLTGHCCFCNKGLTDEKSLAAGFGPVCADHYGLKTEWKLAAAKSELAAGVVASEVVTTEVGESAQEPVQEPLVVCFFCEKPSASTQVIQGYTVCQSCGKQLSK
jgi:hypothetical protein